MIQHDLFSTHGDGASTAPPTVGVLRQVMRAAADVAPGAAVLDPCCGSRMFWYDKEDARAVFGDARREEHTLCDGRALSIAPDVMLDFRDLPFEDGRFAHVVFDPPHLVRAGQTGWQAKKYGVLDAETWRDDLGRGFAECFRVLAPNGTLVFKWNETRISVREVLALTDRKPLYGHRSGARMLTHWICFLNA